MRAWMMVVLGLLLVVSACDVEGDDLGAVEEPIAAESAALSYSWNVDFGDWQACGLTVTLVPEGETVVISAS